MIFDILSMIPRATNLRCLIIRPIIYHSTSPSINGGYFVRHLCLRSTKEFRFRDRRMRSVRYRLAHKWVLKAYDIPFMLIVQSDI